MSDYKQVELYPCIEPQRQSEYGQFVAEHDDWKYTFEVRDDAIVLVEITRPWEVGDPTPPDWVPTAAEERVAVPRTSRVDIPPPVMTALVDRDILGHSRSLSVRAGE